MSSALGAWWKLGRFLSRVPRERLKAILEGFGLLKTTPLCHRAAPSFEWGGSA
jgi:hypothetical protein